MKITAQMAMTNSDRLNTDSAGVDSGLKMEGICGWGVSAMAQGAKPSALATQQPTCRRIALFEPWSAVPR